MRPQSSVGFGENIEKLKNSDKTTFCFLIEAKAMQAPITSKSSEEREFVVDSGASLHMMSKTDLSSEEMGTVKRSRNPTVVLTANGEVHTHEEAQVFVHDLNLFVTVQLLCEDHGYSYGWVSGYKPRLTKDGKSIICKTDNVVPLVVSFQGYPPILKSDSSSTSPSQDSWRREAEQASRDLVRPASSSSSSSVLERSDEPPRNPKPKCVCVLVCVGRLPFSVQPQSTPPLPLLASSSHRSVVTSRVSPCPCPCVSVRWCLCV